MPDYFFLACAPTALTAIAVDGGQTLENGLLFTTKVTFNQDSVSGDHLNNLRELFVGKLSRTDVGIDACLFQDSLRSRVPDSVNIRKGSLDALLVGYFCTEKACHNGLDLLFDFINFTIQFTDEPDGVLQFKGLGRHLRANRVFGGISYFKSHIPFVVAIGGGFEQCFQPC